MEDSSRTLLAFSKELNKLKYVFRLSATRSKYKDSTAAHTWHLALMAYTFQRELSLDIDLEKALKIALVHDLPEIVTGDIDHRLVKDGKVSKEEKAAAEDTAMHEVISFLSADMQKELYELWQEYEKGNSPEARYIKALDKLESFSNSLERGPESFDYTDIIMTYADKAVQNFPELKPYLAAVKQELKQQFAELGIPWKQEYNYPLDA